MIDHGRERLDEFESELEKWVAGIAKVLLILFLGALLGYAWRVIREPAVRDDRPTFETDNDRIDFDRLLRKHGLQYNVSVIFEGRSGGYFIRNGKRCAFK